MKATYFESAAAFRAWLEANHASHREILVGFHKAGTGKPTLTWPESVDQALCFGWIDGRRQGVDAKRYTIRFTPRRARSIWSKINVAKVAALIEAKLMQPAGIRAFAARDDAKTGIYSFERDKAATLDPADEKRFRANTAAWAYFSSRPPSYRRAAYHWVISAKKAETRSSRLATLIADSAAGRHIKPLRRPVAKSATRRRR
ncbi:MAG TPA: YdeI/OmpD-associated family protein [Kofleriaceae bacterium]|nr:YdeI/OmpD-associated family protein [Kofleriaceae bacterium]